MFGILLLIGGVAQFQTGALCRQSRILLREINLRIHRGLLFGVGDNRFGDSPDTGPAGTGRRSRLNGGCRGFRLGGRRNCSLGGRFRRNGRFGSCGTLGSRGNDFHIFSNGADMLFGSREVRFFSSHFSM